MDETCRRPTFASLYSQAVRDHKPVCVLEKMLNVDILDWDAETQQQIITPSDALLLAIKHDHRAYAEYLLSQFTLRALCPNKFCRCCPVFAPHLIMAVRHDRRDIMALILQTVHRVPALQSYINRGDHMNGGKTALHKACELSRLETIVTLLGNGASPQAKDYYDMTPLDVILGQLWISNENTHTKMQCLENLLMFISVVRFKTKSSLEKDPQRWSDLLGEEMFHYLVGREPASLFHMARQRVLSQLRLHEFPESIDKLPIPTFLKPFTQHFPATLRGIHPAGTHLDTR